MEAINPEGEYRVYVSSRGEEPEVRSVPGWNLQRMLGYVRNAHPQDTIYVREITETVVLVIQPEEHIDNGFHFTS